MGAFVNTGDVCDRTQPEAFRREKIGFEVCIFIVVRRNRENSGKSPKIAENLVYGGSSDANFGVEASVTDRRYR